ncbi:MAG: polysaccharide deacetylase family protein [Clostridia bacterium]|nr:polysaccharide deacetylase family protein [Clostridia bacterium]
MKKIIFLMLSLLLISSCGAEKTTTETHSEVEPTPVVTSTPEPTVTPTPTPESTPKATVKPESTPAPAGSIAALDNTGSGWGFVKVKGSKPSIPKKTQELFAKYDTYYMDPREEKVLYLTFDEGYENGFTGQILDTLKECDVPAAFFITGSYFDREQELIKRMVNEGHIVGNHTENHPNLHKLSDPEKMRAEFTELDDKFYNTYGLHMKYMRPPEGEYSERVLALAKDAGYKTILWSFAYKDWLRDDVRGSQYAFDAVTPYLHSGCIILLHAVSQDNADALSDIINYAKEAGYVFKSLDDLP